MCLISSAWANGMQYHFTCLVEKLLCNPHIQFENFFPFIGKLIVSSQRSLVNRAHGQTNMMPNMLRVFLKYGEYFNVFKNSVGYSLDYLYSFVNKKKCFSGQTIFV